MKTVETIGELKAAVRTARAGGQAVGFVPTMGHLHEGHLSLVQASFNQGDWTVVSIFVNPLQFGPGEDFDRYPRDRQRDIQLLTSIGTDLLFIPQVEEMYPAGADHQHTLIRVPEIQGRLCGRSRPGHFDGVATVVAKLLHLVDPDRVYFGEKDYQQILVIETMLRDLAMSPELIRVPIVREKDGLAMSSRNTYLTPAERAAAPLLWRLLNAAKTKIEAGEQDAEVLREWLVSEIEAEPLARLDYAEVVHPETLQPLKRIRERTLVALAVRFGKTRLIDNMLVHRPNAAVFRG